MMNKSLLKSKQKQSGLTLIEIMIAMLLGLILLGGVLQVFSSSRQTYRTHEAVSRMQETGRMALEVLTRDLRMADFWGCASDATDVVNNLDAGGVGFVDFGEGGIGGTDGGGAAPDTLILRGGTNTGIDIEPPYGPQASGVIKVPNGTGLEQEDIVFISDCLSADVFQITNANPDGSGQLVHNTGTGDPGNFNVSNPGCPGANAHCLSKVYGGDASLFVAQEIRYEILDGSEGEKALFRGGLEFLDGVENFQVLYGEDTDGSGTANYYVPATGVGGVANMLNVISIRFAVVVRSYQDNLTGSAMQDHTLFGETVAGTDTRLRQVYTSTVSIRNRL